MRFLSLLILGTLVGAGKAQEDVRVLASEGEPRKMLHNYLLAQAQKHFEARRQIVSQLQTPEDIHKRQQELKARFVAALGGFPEKTPLNAQVVGTLQGDGFRVEKVIFQSRPHHHVTANLYLPQGQTPVPGVLVPCGHSANGKAAEAYQRVCILMAKNGLAVLCYDPIGQGERRQLLSQTGKPAIAGSTSEHTLVGVGALLIGRSTATYRIWDGIRSLDYLASRPEVDPKRLGCTGNSGGGTLTAYLMALDERIVAAAPSCYVTTLERLFATIGPLDAEQNIPGQVAFGMEHTDYVTMRAPRPTLLCVATHDFFDIQGAWTTFREASQIYAKLGHAERLNLVEANEKHGFSKPLRQAAMRWMRRWLLGKDDAPAEEKGPIFQDADLQCTRSGQVLEDFKGKSAFHLNAEEAHALAGQRAKFPELGEEEQRRTIREALGLPASLPKAKERETGTVQRLGYVVHKRIYEVEPGMVVPGLYLEPARPKKMPLLICVDGEGLAQAVKSGGRLEKLASNGQRVLALDLRGLGETAPGGPTAKPGFFGGDFQQAFLGIHLNRPLLGQRVADLLAILPCLGTEASDGIHVQGVGTAGPVALHAAVLDDRIREVTLERSLVSWNSVVQTPITYNQLTNVVPGVLRVYDLPELSASLAPRKLTIRGPLDGAQRAVSQENLAATYRVCLERYAQKKVAANLVLQAAP